MADGDISLRYYTVGQLRSWLEDGVCAVGLSETLVARQRALAIIRNPYAEDTMEVVSALFVGEELAAFTACYPDKPERPDDGVFFWYSTLYCKPEYRGRGFGMFVLSHLAEAHPGRMLDAAAVPETNESLQYLGFSISWFKQYRVVLHKCINGSSFKSVLARIKENLSVRLRRSKIEKLKKSLLNEGYCVEYLGNVDKSLYGFIREHSSDDLFLRSRESLNWILSCPFVLSAEVQSKLVTQNVFSSQAEDFSWRCVRVDRGGMTAGVFFLRISSREVAVKYLYYDKADDAAKKAVFNSILLNLLISGKQELVCNDRALFDYIVSQDVHSKAVVFETSFACPDSFSYDEGRSFQAGDGDMLT